MDAPSISGPDRSTQAPHENDRFEMRASDRLAGVSDRGRKQVRNEDFFSLAANGADRWMAAIVCDGVSDSQSADQAAEAAVAAARGVIMDCLRNADGESRMHLAGHWRQVLASAIEHARAAVEAIPYSRESEQDRPETTIVAALVAPGDPAEVSVAWLGDSRAYFVGLNEARLLTCDHSWVNEVVAGGKMTRAEAMRCEGVNCLTKTLGGPPGEDGCDEPSVAHFQLPASGWLILCTDGLWNYASEAPAFAELARSSAGGGCDALHLARELVNTACQRGGRDNITAVVLAL